MTRSLLARLFPTVLVGVLLSIVNSATAGASSFTIVSRGKSKVEIVQPLNEPLSPIAFAAEELQRYVKEMSGVELPVVSTASKKTAIILRQRTFAGEQDAKSVDRYRLSVEGGNLHIEGASPRAVLFAVYDLLEQLGCGWCVPGDDTIPKSNKLIVSSLPIDRQPAFQYRIMLDFPMMTVAQSIAIGDWIAKNRLNWIHPCPNAFGEPKAWYERRERVTPELKKRGLHLMVGGHTMHTWMPETYFAAHPEWFALLKGERKHPTLCVSNPDMTAEVVKNMQTFLNRCPEVDVVDLWHADDEDFCHCPKCTRGLLAEGSSGATNIPPDALKSAYVFTFVEFINRVAGELAQSHPKVHVGMLIYGQSDRAMPDGCPAPADNVLVGLAHISRDSYKPLAGEPRSPKNQRFLGNDLTWIANSKQHYIYEYYHCWIAPYIYPGSKVIARDLQIFRDLEIQGVSSDMYGYTPINMYVAARAFWEPDLDWRAAVKDFCDRYYGDVATQMADNEIKLTEATYGLRGYQSGGALDPEKPNEPLWGGRYLERQRTEQIAFLKGLIDKTADPQVKDRLQRALKPWELWNKEPRFWAFPDFKDATP